MTRSIARPPPALLAAARRGLRHAGRRLGRQRQEGRRGEEELGQGRRRQGRRRHADDLGPGGPRRPGGADQAPQRGVPGEVPEREDQARREVVHRPPDDAQARGLEQQGARHRRGQPGPPDHGPARQGRAAQAARRLRGRLRLERPLVEDAARPQPLLRRRQAVRRRQPLRRLAEGRDRRRLLQQGQGRHRCPGRSREFEQMLAKAKQDGEMPISFGNLDKFGGIHEFQTVQNQFAEQERDAQLRVRQERRELRHVGEPGGRDEAPGVGRQGLLHARTSTAPATTPPGSSSPRARARSRSPAPGSPSTRSRRSATSSASS